MLIPSSRVLAAIMLPILEKGDRLSCGASTIFSSMSLSTTPQIPLVGVSFESFLGVTVASISNGVRLART